MAVLDRLKVVRKVDLGVLVLEVLLVGLGIWHLGLTHGTGVHKGLGSGCLLVMILLLPDGIHLLLRLLLGLDFLLTARHAPEPYVTTATQKGDYEASASVFSWLLRAIFAE